MTASAAFSHCSFCGARFADGAPWPRTCSCGNVSYRNPAPVAVLVVPVEDAGVLLVRRAQPPVGLALPSGFIEYGERWQDAAARELAEETGIEVDAAAIEAFRVRTGSDGTLLVFAAAPAVTFEELGGFVPSDEVSELVVADRPVEGLVFPLDAEVVADRLAATGSRS